MLTLFVRVRNLLIGIFIYWSVYLCLDFIWPFKPECNENVIMYTIYLGKILLEKKRKFH